VNVDELIFGDVCITHDSTPFKPHYGTTHLDINERADIVNNFDG
jgi:hypothetical protein